MAFQGPSRTIEVAIRATGAVALACTLAFGPAFAQNAAGNRSRSLVQDSSPSMGDDQGQSQNYGLRGAVAPALRPLVERDSALAAARAGQTAPPQPATYSAGTGEAAPDAAINYGKPRKPVRLPKPYPPRRAGKPPLPPLEAYKNSYVTRQQAHQARQRALSDPQMQTEIPPTGVAVVPTIPVKPRRPPEANPYEPTGVDIGSLRLRPYIEGAFGYDTNPGRVTNPRRGSTLGRIDGGMAIESLWSAHELKGELRGGYSDFFQVRNVDRPDGTGKLDGRIDITRDTSFDYGGAGAISTLRQGSPEIQMGGNGLTTTNQPITWNLSGYAGATHRFNRLELSMRGSIERSENADATFSDGTKQLLHLNDYTTVGVRPRISYEVSPLFKPFVEATVDKRTYDNTTDVNGFLRNSHGYSVRAGATFEIDGKLRGEASAGYIERDYKDPRLVKLRGPTIDASLIWTATPLTTVTLRGTTTVNETTVPNASGAIARSATVEIAHELLRNVKISGLASYQVTTYKGDFNAAAFTGGSTGLNERTITGAVKAEYSLTRTVVIKASYAYERLKSTAQGADYTSNIFLLGLRLQR
ncbi:MAG: outer membrane beta-barrel protein [Rhodoblastus sp.]